MDLLYSWSIDARWLSDRTVSATARTGSDLEHVNAVLQPLGWAKISLFYADIAFIKRLAPMIFKTRFKL
ncbi:hypothetical protein PS943_04197 [Pseudomonas fluorescens]|jgi:hypothetical protein|uniref:Uncharacterized protein n=1 Tax=Pseudomonas fluorescens TaxID=294 RepID=A0A5E7WK63_PSEFL|nr:hypothetical protein PS943_04197 [Pseudomonas fluorescens]